MAYRGIVLSLVTLNILCAIVCGAAAVYAVNGLDDLSAHDYIMEGSYKELLILVLSNGIVSIPLCFANITLITRSLTIYNRSCNRNYFFGINILWMVSLLILMVITYFASLHYPESIGSTLDSKFRIYIKSYIHSKRKNVTGVLNNLQMQFQCCGRIDFKEYFMFDWVNREAINATGDFIPNLAMLNRTGNNKVKRYFGEDFIKKGARMKSFKKDFLEEDLSIHREDIVRVHAVPFSCCNMTYYSRCIHLPIIDTMTAPGILKRGCVDVITNSTLIHNTFYGAFISAAVGVNLVLIMMLNLSFYNKLVEKQNKLLQICIHVARANEILISTFGMKPRSKKMRTNTKMRTCGRFVEDFNEEINNTYNKANPFKDDSYSDEVLYLSRFIKEPPLLYNEVQEGDLYITDEETKAHLLLMGGFDMDQDFPAEREEGKPKSNDLKMAGKKTKKAKNKKTKKPSDKPKKKPGGKKAEKPKKKSKKKSGFRGMSSKPLGYM